MSLPNEVRAALLQAGRIGHLQYVMEGEHGKEYLEWCKAHNQNPSDDSAELFVEQTEFDMLEHKQINNEYDGIWQN